MFGTVPDFQRCRAQVPAGTSEPLNKSRQVSIRIVSASVFCISQRSKHLRTSRSPTAHAVPIPSKNAPHEVRWWIPPARGWAKAGFILRLRWIITAFKCLLFGATSRNWFTISSRVAWPKCLLYIRLNIMIKLYISYYCKYYYELFASSMCFYWSRTSDSQQNSDFFVCFPLKYTDRHVKFKLL